MKVEIEYRPLAALKPDPRNARLHSDAQIEEIAGSIRRFGFVNPVLAREDGTIVAGEGRWRAAGKLGLVDVPVIELHGLTEAQCRALALADNRIGLNSSWDQELLARSIDELTAAGEPTSDLGFDRDELAALMNPGTVTVEAVNVGPLDDRFWIAVRGPLKDQAHALQRIQTVMAEFPAIEVELGTVGVQD
jgi:ParB-like chromosome segregation protein Spo0J